MFIGSGSPKGCGAMHLCCVFGLFALSCTSMAGPVFDVYILTGQSNSLGTTANPREKGAGPGRCSADGKIRFFWSNRSTRAGDGRAVLIGDSGGKFTALKPQQGEGANPSFWGPEFGFCRRLYELGRRNIVLIKASRGGGGNTYWLKNSRDDHMYKHVVSTAKRALKALPPGAMFRVRAILYVQGESDSAREASLAGERLGRLLDNLRNDLPQAKDAVLIVGGIAAAGHNRDVVRQRQKKLAQQRRDVIYVDNVDLRSRLYDRLHFDKAAKLELGKRLADCYQAYVSKRLRQSPQSD